MATITSLVRAKEQPQISTSGATTNGSENWVMKIDSFANTVEANVLIKSLGVNNSFDFTIVGSVHPADSSLQILSFSCVQLQAEGTYTVYLVTTNFSNDKEESDNNVAPAQAQDSYTFDSVDYEVIVSETQGVSRVDPTNTLGLTLAGEAIQNTNGIGIIATETEQIQEVTIVRNEEDFSIKTAAKHLGRVNSSPVTLVGETFKAGQCKLDRWSAQDMYDSEGSLYYRVTYKISVANEADFFERRFISRGVIDGNGDAPPAALGLIADTEYKLDVDGNFFNKEDQKDPSKFYAQSFVTKKSSNWNGAVRLQETPNPNIITLAGGDNTFGLQAPL